jgi:hypothetical protein
VLHQHIGNVQLLLVLPCCALQSDKTKALFQVAVSFEPHGMAFSPTETAILDEINANTLEGIVSVAQVSRSPGMNLALSRSCAGVFATANQASACVAQVDRVLAYVAATSCIIMAACCLPYVVCAGCTPRAVHACLCAPV